MFTGCLWFTLSAINNEFSNLQFISIIYHELELLHYINDISIGIVLVSVFLNLIDKIYPCRNAKKASFIYDRIRQNDKFVRTVFFYTKY